MENSHERCAAFEELLAQPDPSDLKLRGHVLTQPGKRERWVETWLPAVNAWTTARISAATDPEDGWKPARRLSQPLFLTPIEGLVIRENWRRNAMRTH